MKYSETLAADGDGAVYACVDGSNSFETVPVGFSAGNDFGGGTLTTEVSVDDGVTFEAVADASWVAAIGDKLEFPQGAWFKFVLAGATSPDLDISVSGNITLK